VVVGVQSCLEEFWLGRRQGQATGRCLDGAPVHTDVPFGTAGVSTRLVAPESATVQWCEGEDTSLDWHEARHLLLVVELPLADRLGSHGNLPVLWPMPRWSFVFNLTTTTTTLCQEKH